MICIANSLGGIFITEAPIEKAEKIVDQIFVLQHFRPPFTITLLETK